MREWMKGIPEKLKEHQVMFFLRLRKLVHAIYKDFLLLLKLKISIKTLMFWIKNKKKGIPL